MEEGGVCERIKRGRIQEEGSEKKKKKIRNKNEKQRIKNIEVVDPIDLRKKLLYQFYILKQLHVNIYILRLYTNLFPKLLYNAHKL